MKKIVALLMAMAFTLSMGPAFAQEATKTSPAPAKKGEKAPVKKAKKDKKHGKKKASKKTEAETPGAK
jgi:hypothetical protein